MHVGIINPVGPCNYSTVVHYFTICKDLHVYFVSELYNKCSNRSNCGLQLDCSWLSTNIHGFARLTLKTHVLSHTFVSNKFFFRNILRMYT
jgi:hypothetical protein